MRIEIPELKRCCCCLPLRRGLIFWAYLKLVFGVLLLLHSSASIVQLTIVSYHNLQFQITVVSIMLIMSLLEIAFCILFLVSAHRKNPDHMRIYYRYSIGILIFEVLGLLGCSAFTIYISSTYIFVLIFLYRVIVEALCLIVLLIVLQTYFVILVRSEILKLENSVKFEFVNNTIEPECKVEIMP